MPVIFGCFDANRIRGSGPTQKPLSRNCAAWWPNFANRSTQQAHILRLVKMTFGPGGERIEGPTLFDGLDAESDSPLSTTVESTPYIGTVTAKRKIVHAWAFEGDCDPMAIVSKTFTMEWLPKSGRRKAFPEMDRADFFSVAEAMRKIKRGQDALITELRRMVG
jgi:hypothetical protein